jgi:uncharacterized protein YkwD
MTKPILALVLAATAALCAAPAVAAACGRALPAGADAVIEAGAKIDQDRIDAAIRAEVNHHRCKAGLSGLAAAKGLRRVAGTHAGWMARTGDLSHRSTVAGQTTTLTRLKASGLRFRAGSENIGYLARYRIDGAPFRIRDAASCGFADPSGRPIPPHSYASLAQQIVGLWMQSPTHRRNILDPRVSKVGSAIGFDAAAPNCGRFYVSQSFAG